MRNVPHDNSWLMWSSLAIDDSRCIPPITSTKHKFYSDALNIVVISLPDFQSQVELLQLNTALDKFIWLFSNLGSNTDGTPEWAFTDTSFKRVLQTMNLASLKLRELTFYEAELDLQKDMNDAERYKQLEREVKCFMKAVLIFTDYQTAYDSALEEFGPDITLVLGERPPSG